MEYIKLTECLRQTQNEKSSRYRPTSEQKQNAEDKKRSFCLDRLKWEQEQQHEETVSEAD